MHLEVCSQTLATKKQKLAAKPSVLKKHLKEFGADVKEIVANVDESNIDAAAIAQAQQTSPACLCKRLSEMQGGEYAHAGWLRIFRGFARARCR